jgi:hypothetical protein
VRTTAAENCIPIMNVLKQMTGTKNKGLDLLKTNLNDIEAILYS